MIFDKEIVRYYYGYYDYDYCYEYIYGDICYEYLYDYVYDYDYEYSYEELLEFKDEKILKIFLVYWINYNEIYEEGFREWVEKVRVIGKEEIVKSIEKVIEYMEEVNKMLLEVKKYM